MIDQLPLCGCVGFHLLPTQLLAKGCKGKGSSSEIFFPEKGIQITQTQFESQTMALSSLPLSVRQDLIQLKVPEELFGMDFNPFVLSTSF